MLTGDHWSAEEAYRMGEVQKVAPDAKEALEAGIRIANKIADCGPLGIKTSLASAHLAIDHPEEEALSKLDAQFGALFHTQDWPCPQVGKAANHMQDDKVAFAEDRRDLSSIPCLPELSGQRSRRKRTVPGPRDASGSGLRTGPGPIQNSAR
jgi:hypothetical protein